MGDRISFDSSVWDAVSRIPHGRLATYGQIADLIGAYGYARQGGVGLASPAFTVKRALASGGECSGAYFNEPQP